VYCVYSAVSQNGGLPLINASIYSIDTTFYVLFSNVTCNSNAIIAKKQPKLWSQKKEHIRPGPSLRFVSVYMRTVRKLLGAFSIYRKISIWSNGPFDIRSLQAPFARDFARQIKDMAANSLELVKL